MNDDAPLTILEEITTRWSVIANPMTFVLRYGPAVRSYMAVLLPNRHDAEDATQDFLLRTLRQPSFGPGAITRGRFRDYLKATIRNAAIDHHRKRQRTDRATSLVDEAGATANDVPADTAWDREWRQVLLDRCWEGLESIQRGAKGNYAYTVLRLTTEYSGDDSTALATKLSTKVGSPITPEAFRKQRSRARREFARLLVAEVKQTLESLSADVVVEELAALQLLDYVREYLPERYRAETVET